MSTEIIRATNKVAPERPTAPPNEPPRGFIIIAEKLYILENNTAIIANVAQIFNIGMLVPHGVMPNDMLPTIPGLGIFLKIAAAKPCDVDVEIWSRVLTWNTIPDGRPNLIFHKNVQVIDDGLFAPEVRINLGPSAFMDAEHRKWNENNITMVIQYELYLDGIFNFTYPLKLQFTRHFNKEEAIP